MIATLEIFAEQFMLQPYLPLQWQNLHFAHFQSGQLMTLYFPVSPGRHHPLPPRPARAALTARAFLLGEDLGRGGPLRPSGTLTAATSLGPLRLAVGLVAIHGVEDHAVSPSSL